MFFLFLVSVIWAFSFGLIKTSLSGLDSNFVSFGRMFISFLVFVPFLKVKDLPRPTALALFFTGMVQYGIMYIAYIYSFRYLQAYEVALFTIFTPLYVSLINDWFSKKFHGIYLISAILAFAGAGIIRYSAVSTGSLLIGFLLVQISNLGFALGQILYRRILMNRPEIPDKNIFALLYAGAAFITLVASLFTTDYAHFHIQFREILTLLYLGAIASGLGFFLWNYGARKTNIGVLAIFNNLKIPLAVAISMLVFHEKTQVWRLVIGCAIVLVALYLNEKWSLKK